MDVPEALQLAAGGPVTRSQLLYLLDRSVDLCVVTLGLLVPQVWMIVSFVCGIVTSLDHALFFVATITALLRGHLAGIVACNQADSSA